MLHIMRARARVRRPAAGYVENVVALEASPFASNPLAAERERAAAGDCTPAGFTEPQEPDKVGQRNHDSLIHSSRV